MELAPIAEVPPDFAVSTAKVQKILHICPIRRILL
jgi:hypothetical protein